MSETSWVQRHFTQKSTSSKMVYCTVVKCVWLSTDSRAGHIVLHVMSAWLEVLFNHKLDGCYLLLLRLDVPYKPRVSSVYFPASIYLIFWNLPAAPQSFGFGIGVVYILLKTFRVAELAPRRTCFCLHADIQWERKRGKRGNDQVCGGSGEEQNVCVWCGVLFRVVWIKRGPTTQWPQCSFRKQVTSQTRAERYNKAHFTTQTCSLTTLRLRAETVTKDAECLKRF